MPRERAKDLFSPTKLIQKLPLWFDAFDIGTMSINASNQVASVRNKGYAGGDFVQATDANKPLMEMGAINGHPALRGFNAATGSSLSLADSTALDYVTHSIFAVIRRHTDPGAVVQLIGGKYNTTGDQREHRLRVTATTYTLTGDISTDGIATTPSTATAMSLAIDTNYIVETQRGAVALAVAINYAAGANAAAAATPPFQGTSPYQLFGRNSSGDPFHGYIGEYLFFNQVLPTEERKLVIKYLSKKWGIQPTW